MATQSVKIPVELEVQMREMGSQIDKIRQLMGKIDPNTKGFSKLETQLKSIDREFQNIRKRAGETFTTQGQINTFSRKFEHLQTMTEDFGDSLKKIKFTAFKDDVFDQSILDNIKNTKDEIGNLEKEMAKLGGDAFVKTAKSSKELVDTLKEIGVNSVDELVDEKKAVDSFNKIKDSSKALKKELGELDAKKNSKTNQKEREALTLDKKDFDLTTAIQEHKKLQAATEAARKELEAFQKVQQSVSTQDKRKSLSDTEATLNRLGVEKANFKTKAGRAQNGKDYFGDKGDKLDKDKLLKHLMDDLSFTKEDLDRAGALSLTEQSLDAFYKNLADILKEKKESFEQEIAKIDKDVTDADAALKKAEGAESTGKDKVDAAQAQFNKQKQIVDSLSKEITDLEKRANEVQAKIDRNTAATAALEQAGKDRGAAIDAAPQIQQIKELERKVRDLEEALRKSSPTGQELQRTVEDIGNGAQKGEGQVRGMGTSLEQMNESARKLNSIQDAIKRWFGFHEVINLTKRTISDAINHIRELDKVMTEIAVVTDMTQKELWDQIETYSAMAQKYGATTEGVYEVSQLYYQQGLQTADVMRLTEETLKMAKIANIDYADATDYMTVAIRGFKMEMSDAQNVVDVYSNIAAITASDTEELAIAMSKTASSAEAVGSSFENTTAMIALMVETTREAPENIGSAMKSIISRYGEMTTNPAKLVDSEGEAMSLNKVDKALSSVGITLQDVNGQFRDFDEVILELSSKWDTIDKNTQRYIATVMAGNRQQSRFLALVGNYDRLSELYEEAADSQDAATLQTLKTMDSIETKINQLKTTFQEFYTNTGVEELIKGILDFATTVIERINSIPKAFDKIPIAAIGMIGTLITTAKAGISLLMRGIFQVFDSILPEVKVKGIKIGQYLKEGIEEGTKGAGEQVVNELDISKRRAKWGTALGSIGSIVSTLALTLGDLETEQGRVTSGWFQIAGGAASALGQAMTGNYIGAAITAVSTLTSAIATMEETTEEKIDRLEKRVSESSNELLTSKNELKTLIDYKKKYEQLSKSQYKSVEAKQEFIDLQNEIAEKYPTLISGMDAEGNYLINLTNGYENLYKAKKAAYQSDFVQQGVDTIAAFSDNDYLLKMLGYEAPGNYSPGWSLGQKFNPSTDKVLSMAGQYFQDLSAEEWGGLSYQQLFSNAVDYAFDQDMGSLRVGYEYSTLFGYNLTDENELNALLEYTGLDAGDLGTDEGLQHAFSMILQQAGRLLDEGKTLEEVNEYFRGILGENFELSPELIGSMQELKANSKLRDDYLDGIIKQLNLSQVQNVIANEQLELGAMETDFINEEIQKGWEEFYNSEEIQQKIIDGTITVQDAWSQYVLTIEDQVIGLADGITAQGGLFEGKTQKEIDAINAIYSNRATYSLEEYQSALEEAGASEEIITLAMKKWEEDTSAARDRFIEGFTSLKGTAQFDANIDEKITQVKNDIAPYLLDAVLAQFEYAMRNIDTDEEGAEAAVNALGTFYNTLNELGPEAERIAANADLTSLSGIDTMLAEMEEAGIDISSIDMSDWIDTLTINLEVEWETYTEKIASNMENFQDAIKKASEGMSLEDAIKMANKLGISLEDFRFEDGKYFLDNTQLIIDGYREYSQRQRTFLDEQMEGMYLLIDAVENAEGEYVFNEQAIELPEGLTVNEAEEGDLTFEFGEGINDELQALLSGKEQEYIAWLRENKLEHSDLNLNRFIFEELDSMDDNYTQMIEEYQTHLVATAYLAAGNLAKFFETLGLTAEEQAQITEALKTGDTSDLTGRALDIYYEYEDDLTNLITSTISDMTDAALEAISTGKTQRVDITNLADYNPELAGKIQRGELGGISYQTSEDGSRAYALIDPNISEEAYKIFLEGLNYGPEEYNEAMVDFFDARHKDIEGALESVLSDSNNIDYATIADFATSLGYTVDELLAKGIFSLNPDDLTYNISDYSALEQEVQGKVTYAQEMIADSISDFLDSTLELVSNGISGSLTHVEFSQLGEYIAKLTGKQLDLQFIETSEGLKLTQASVLQIYNSLKDVDSIAAQVVLDELAESAMDSDERLNNIYNVTKDIADLNKQIESAKPNSKRKEMLEAELALAENIRDTLLEAGNAFNFMNQDLPTSLSNPLSLWEGAGDALKILDGDEFKNGTGYIDYTDFYNMINMMEQMGVDLSTVATSVNGNTVSAMELLKAAGQSMTIVDGVPMVSLTNFGESFKLDTEGMRNGIAEGIHTLASEQIELIDSQIAILETVVAMEKIGDELDIDQSGLIDLDEILSPDKKGFSEGAENYLDYLEYFAGEITVDGINLEAALASLDPQKLMEFFNGLQTLIKDTDWSNAEEASKAIKEFISTFFFGSEVNFDQSNFGSFGGAISQQWQELTGEFKYIINGKEVLKEQWDDLINNLNTMASDYAEVLTSFGFVIPENFEGTVAQVLELNGMINPTDVGFFIDGLSGGPWETREAAIEAWIEANGLEGLESTGATYHQDDYNFGNDTFETLTLEVGGVSIEKEYRVHDAGDGNLQYLYNGDVYSSLEALKASIMLFEGDYNDGDFININNGETSKTYTIRTENGLQYLVELDSEGNEVKFIVNGQEVTTPEGVTTAVEEEREEAENEAAVAAAAGGGEGETEVASTEMAVKIIPVSVSVEATDGEGNLTVTEEITSAKASVAELIITPTKTSLAEGVTLKLGTTEGGRSIEIDEATILALSMDGVISDNGSGGFKLNGTLEELEAKIATLENPANLIDNGKGAYTLEGTNIVLDASVVSKLGEEGILTPTEQGYTLTGKTTAEAAILVSGFAADGLISDNSGVYTFTGEVEEIDLDIAGDPTLFNATLDQIRTTAQSNPITFKIAYESTGESAPEGPQLEQSTQDKLYKIFNGYDFIGQFTNFDLSAIESYVEALRQAVEQGYQLSGQDYSNLILFGQVVGDISGYLSDEELSALYNQINQLAGVDVTQLTTQEAILNSLVEQLINLTTAAQEADGQTVDITVNKTEEKTGTTTQTVTTNEVKNTSFTADVSGATEAMGAVTAASNETDTSNAIEGINSFQSEASDTGDALTSASNAVQSGYNTIRTNLISLGALMATTGVNVRNFAAKLREIPSGTKNLTLSVTVKASGAGTGEVKGDFKILKTGNVALAKGTQGPALAKGKTLMGELGPELVVSNGRYFTVGNNGAEFVDLPSDAIVFNHLQTQKLLGSGGMVGTGEPVTNERNAVALAGGNATGPAMANAADALAELYKLRAMWQGLLNASAQELGKKGAGLGSGNKPGGNGGGDNGGGSGGDGDKTNLHDLERWYNLMRQIAKLEQQVTLEQAKRNNMRNGADINKSREKELKLLEKQRDANKELAEQQKKYYDERREVLNSTDYSKIFTYDEDGLMQYVSGEDRGLDALSKLNATDKNGKPVMSSKEQLQYLKNTLGFDISTLKTNADGTKTNDPAQMMQNFWDGIDGWMGEMDGLYDSYNDAAIAMEEATSAMNDLLQEQIDNQITVEEKMLKALEGQRQAAIDSIQEEKDLLEAAAQEYIDGLTSALEKERSMYEKNESQAETEKLQRRLAILQRSGGSASEIKSLQDQIDSRLKDAYFEEQQAQIDAIQEASNNEIEKLQNQIDIMTEALEYQKENGLLWTEIYEMMNTWSPEQLLQYIIENDPDYQSGSPTQNQENADQTRIELEDWVDTRTQNQQKEQREKDWNDYYSGLDKYSDEQKAEHAEGAKKAFMDAYTAEGGNLEKAIAASNAYYESKLNTDGGGGDDGGDDDKPVTGKGKVKTNGSNLNVRSGPGTDKKILGTVKNGASLTLTGYKGNWYQIDYNGKKGYVYSSYVSTNDKKKLPAFKQGGLVDFTGPAWVDGSKSKPEAFLSAEDTAMLKSKIFSNSDGSLKALVAALEAITNDTSKYSSTAEAGGSIVIQNAQVNIQPGTISNDYDARRAGEMALEEMVKIARKTTNRVMSR